MNRPFAHILAIIIYTSIVMAAGGGGGSSSSGSGSSSSGSGDSSSGSDFYFSSPICDDTGKVTFRQKPSIKPVIAEIGSANVQIKGIWEGTEFISEEAEANENGEYIIRDAVNGDRKFECPGLSFSCRMVNISIGKCTYSNKGTKAPFKLEGPKTSKDSLKIKFSFPDSPVLSYSKGIKSSELDSLRITDEGLSLYSIDAPIYTESLMQISYEGCLGNYYVYSQIKCTEDEPASEKKGSELKCGGYLDIEDRVGCRISLREEKSKEYENFFPEECMARDDWKECLKVYQSVQKCWSFPNGNERISCVKGQLDLGDIAKEKDSCSDKNCLAMLREKIYSLIKFRLYNLEEEAEILMEDGELERNDLIDFVVRMEKTKLAFNNAKTKADRKAAILKASEAWKGLVAKVKK